MQTIPFPPDGSTGAKDTAQPDQLQQEDQLEAGQLVSSADKTGKKGTPSRTDR